MSATEWKPSASIAELPVMAAAMNLITAMIAFAIKARKTRLRELVVIGDDLKTPPASDSGYLIRNPLEAAQQRPRPTALAGDMWAMSRAVQ